MRETKDGGLFALGGMKRTESSYTRFVGYHMHSGLCKIAYINA